MGIEWNDISSKSNGGTEKMGHLLEDTLPKDLLDEFQIILTRMGELNPDKYRILWIHDLDGDPSVAHLANEGWKKFHRLVFVSNWQMQRFIERFQIPWSKCIVMQNAIRPIFSPRHTDNSNIKLVYHTTPHRGLNILLATFEKLLEKHSNIELHVYSSFELYGWKNNDEQFKPLFDYMNNHEKIFNHGTVPNEVIRQELCKMDIFSYPSVWQETSCICLMEAMSAGLQCVHPNLGALYETGANWTSMYHFQDDANQHAQMFLQVLDNAVSLVGQEQTISRLGAQKTYADVFYNWDMRAQYWESFLKNILETKEDKGMPREQFTYRI